MPEWRQEADRQIIISTMLSPHPATQNYLLHLFFLTKTSSVTLTFKVANFLPLF